jgi:hypothetical protein
MRKLSNFKFTALLLFLWGTCSSQNNYVYLRPLKVEPKLKISDFFKKFSNDKSIDIPGKEELTAVLGYLRFEEGESKCEGAIEVELFVLIDEFEEGSKGKLYKIGRFHSHEIDLLEYKNGELIIHISSAVCYQDRRKINYYKIKI